MDIIEKLKRLSVETGSLACLGCGREHNCSVQGCAILREAVDEIEALRWSQASPVTNADRIRAMSDEELEQIIMCPYDVTVSDRCCSDEERCTACCLDWLKQPAESADG